MQYYAGIDVGGTKVYSVIIDEKGKIHARAKLKVGGDKDFDSVFKKIIKCYKKALDSTEIDDSEVKAVGVAVPSAVDVKKGVVKYATNLGWGDVRIDEMLRDSFKKDVFVDNDVNMGVFGEYSFGEAKKFESIYGLFIGTGIGGGYIHKGEIIRGKSSIAGEVGHMIVELDGPPCNCGNRGCIEALASKLGIIHYMKKLVDKKGKKTILDELAPKWRDGVGSSALRKAYEKKDKVVMKAIDRAAEIVGIACGNLVNIMGVDAIILGGGVIEEMPEHFIPTINKRMVECSMAGGGSTTKVLESKLGDDAVALGAAWFTRLPEKADYLFKYKS